jgi:4-hydroxy-3-methylbut-2-enyl diphosphate reductase
MGCDRVHHIEGEGELEASWFDGARSIGVTAGASTPQGQIDVVCSRIAELSGGTLDAPEGK